MDEQIPTAGRGGRWLQHCQEDTGDRTLSKKPENVEREVRLRFAIHNNMIDQAVSKGYVGVRVRPPCGKGETTKAGAKRAGDERSVTACRAIGQAGGGQADRAIGQAGGGQADRAIGQVEPEAAMRQKSDRK